MKKENIDLEEDLNGDSSQDLQDLESFKKKFIDTHRGRPIFMVRIEDIKGISLIDFINLLKTEIHRFPDIKILDLGFYFIEARQSLLLGIASGGDLADDAFPNLDSYFGKLHQESLRKKKSVNLIMEFLERKVIIFPV